MNHKITFSSYLSCVSVIALLYMTLPMLLSYFASDTFSSYASSALCFFILVVCSIKLILKDNEYVKFYSIAFVLQLLIGLVHYLYFVDIDYFNTDGSVSDSFWHEYLSVFNALNRLQDARHNWGVFYWMNSHEFQVSHPEIWHIISWPFYYLSNRWLNYAPLNVFSALFTSANILFLYKRNFNGNKRVHNALLFWTSFFPSFLLNDTVWRDPFGVCLISIALVLVSLSNSIVTKIISFVLLGFTSFIQRTMYLLMAVVSVMWGNMQKSKNIVLKICYIVVGGILLVYMSNFTDEANGSGYNAGYVNEMSYLALPIKIVFGMIGPFPWTMFSNLVATNPAFAWQLQDYLMGTFQFGYLLAICIKWNKFSFRSLDAMTVMGLGIMLSGFMSKQMHIGYISEGLLFTLPWFFSCIGCEYRMYFKSSFLVLVSLNILLLFVGNIGIGSLWH